MFGRKRLGGNEILEEEGVTDGAKLNLVPGKTSSTSKPSSVSLPATDKTTIDMTVDMNQMDAFMKSMGGGDNKPPTVQESMEMMSEMMNSPIFQEYMSDPEKLEQSRQMILQNPLLKSMMAGMPGMEEVLNDPMAWREAMQAAANLYKSMDTEELMKALMGEGGPPGGGMFDGSLDTTPMAALDELSEGED